MSGPDAAPEEAITLGAPAEPGCAGAGLVVDVERRSEVADDVDPNGWFAGPQSDPNRFQLLGEGLSGGEGITWRARYWGRLTAPLTLAVKQLRRPPGSRADWPSAEDLRWWEDQKALLQYLKIDHLVTVIDIFVGAPPHFGQEPAFAGPPVAGAVPDTPYVVMEWVPGQTLFEEISGIPATSASLGERLGYLSHVAQALHALHSRTGSGGNPALHRDVKPTNCILDPARGLVLVDIGTMRLMDDGYDHSGFHTPAYTAPEVLDDPRRAREASSDLYSLGALAYFCVLGEDPPVAGRPGADQVLGRNLLAGARAARVADAAGFVDHLRLMLHPQPDQRPSDPLAWARRLHQLAVPGGFLARHRLGRRPRRFG
jgi:serine/threonine-protein kinase